VPASEFSRAMARVAPADLAAALRGLAGPETASGPGEAEQALAALYEKHAVSGLFVWRQIDDQRQRSRKGTWVTV
jgi:hypothetical protein